MKDRYSKEIRTQKENILLGVMFPSADGPYIRIKQGKKEEYVKTCDLIDQLNFESKNMC